MNDNNLNENNLFDENQFEQPFQPVENPVEATVEETVSEEPVQPIEQQTPAVDLGINVLNNVGADAPNVKTQIKKSTSKTPFIIIAAVLLLSLFVGGTGVVVKNVFFDKAPHKIDVPGDDEEDAQHMIDEENTEEETDESEETPESEEDFVDEDEKEDEETENQGGTTTGDESTIEEAIDNSKEQPSKIYIEQFETDRDAIGFLYGGDTSYFEIEKVSEDIVIYKFEMVEGEMDPTTKTEVFRKTFDPIEFTGEDGAFEIISFTIKGTVANDYLLVQAVRGDKEGEYMILNKDFNVMYHFDYYPENEPVVTDEAIYYGVINCNGKTSKNKTGPVINIYKFNTKTGVSSKYKTIDYANEQLYCQ